jgi:hypothetical protein
VATLMYTSHPSKNSLAAIVPQNIADAVRHQHDISYSSLREMRDLIVRLAARTQEVNPSLIPFFATGGIPYVFPLMHVLDDQGHRELLDGSHFLMFPGPTWKGKIDGRTSLEFFVERFGPLLVRALDSQDRVCVQSIDTTNTGNSALRFVNAMQAVCDAFGITQPGRLSVDVVSIVDAARATDGSHEAAAGRVESQLGPIPILIPSGYTPAGTLTDSVPTEFLRDDGRHNFRLFISFWIASNIPTEDRAELVGAYGDHDLLSVVTAGNPGRINITFSGGTSSLSTGLNTPGHRIINLLSEPSDSWEWRHLEQCENMGPLTGEQEEFKKAASVWSEAGLRLIELQHTDEQTAVKSLKKINRLLTGVEIYWLSTLRTPPKDLLRKVIATLKRDPAVNESIHHIRKASESSGPETVEAEATVCPEAVAFFRQCKPELAAREPKAEMPALARWWLKELS